MTEQELNGFVKGWCLYPGIALAECWLVPVRLHMGPYSGYSGLYYGQVYFMLWNLGVDGGCLHSFENQVTQYKQVT